MPAQLRNPGRVSNSKPASTKCVIPFRNYSPVLQGILQLPSALSSRPPVSRRPPFYNLRTIRSRGAGLSVSLRDGRSPNPACWGAGARAGRAGSETEFRAGRAVATYLHGPHSWARLYSLGACTWPAPALAAPGPASLSACPRPPCPHPPRRWRVPSAAPEVVGQPPNTVPTPPGGQKVRKNLPPPAHLV